MVNNLFKKSYLHNSLKKIPYDNLLNTKGVFTTVRVRGVGAKLIFFKYHILQLNNSLKKLNISYKINIKSFESLIDKNFKKNIYYNHLLRIAVNSRKLSIDLRKRLNHQKFYKAILINYIRPNPEIKNLKYAKIIKLIKKINIRSTEIILFNKDIMLEGCTTNIICVRNNNLYIPKNNYYFGITLKLLAKYTKRRIIKSNIYLKELNSFDEIILTGSGKGIVALRSIPQIKWKNKSQIIYNELQELYNIQIER